MRQDDFEQTLGYRFSDPELLRTALTYFEANAAPDSPWLIATRAALAREPRR